EITKYLIKNKLGKKTTQYKLKDWLVSRQRYWGTPIPVIYCNKCGIVPVPEKELPIKLPDKVEFGKGNPLLTNKEFVNTKCPKCNSSAKRETDTMDTFFDSSWYYMRYPDNKNNKKPFENKIENYWLPVDTYIGGAEHACMHLLYARFFTKALRDLGFINYNEPFTQLFNQGMLHAEDGRKMSKSLGNVINPLEMINSNGADSLRLTLMSFASPDSDTNWNKKVLQGSEKFLKKVYETFEKVKIRKSTPKIESKLNKTIKEITNDIENFKYNLGIIKLRNLFDSLGEQESKETLEKSLQLLHPFCPHITEELWEKLGHKNFISLSEWPKADESKINKKFEEQDQAIEKLINDINNISKLITDKGDNFSKIYVYVLPNEKEIYSENINEIKKRTNENLILYAVNDKDKYDPENKSKKVKPGRPGIYFE
ncbi:MAG: class I tRNA ligase family protein, partial [Minisyncoccales bacterium]